MICKFCATGADVMSRANELVPSLGPSERKKFVKMSKFLHEQCKGRTSCDCQHKEPIANGS